MKIAVFGANGPTGQLLTQQALAAGHHVTAFTRHPETFPSLGGNLHVHGGDVHDREAVEVAITGQDAVVSTLGVPFGPEPVSVYSAGVSQPHRGHDPTRGEAADLRELLDHGTAPDTAGRRRLPQGHAALRREQARPHRLRGHASHGGAGPGEPDGLDHRASVGTVPGRLGDRLRTHEDAILGRFTAREDLADCLLHQTSDRTYVNRALAVATVAIKPNMLKLIWREGIRKNP